MKRLHLILPLFLLAPLASAADLQAAADDICECFKEPYALIEKTLAQVQQAQASGDYSKLAQAQGEMMGLMNGTEECFADLPAKYPEIDKSEELKRKVMEIVDKQCPNPAAQFQFGRPG